MFTRIDAQLPQVLHYRSILHRPSNMMAGTVDAAMSDNTCTPFVARIVYYSDEKCLSDIRNISHTPRNTVRASC